MEYYQLEIFEQIYETDAWKAGSGRGSLPGVTTAYRNYLQDFLQDRQVRTVLDFGCGDWQFSKLIDWSGVNYLGVDVVESVIARNRTTYGADTISFRHVTNGMEGLPGADLLIIKDVLQHLSNADISRFASKVLPRYRWALVTNCIRPVWRVNHDISTGGFRPVDLRRPPWEITGERVLSFHGPWALRRGRPSRWRKHTVLIER